eukprot:8393696-Pyramimonas_sp.AAC.1
MLSRRHEHGAPFLEESLTRTGLSNVSRIIEPRSSLDWRLVRRVALHFSDFRSGGWRVLYTGSSLDNST